MLARLAPPGGEAAVSVRRGTVYGNPFVARCEGEAATVRDAYADLIAGGEGAHVVARRWATERGPLRVHEASARTRPVARQKALEHLARRAADGWEPEVRHDCAWLERCHACVLLAWVKHRASRPR